MTDYLTEQEQIDLLKNWLKQYSFVIITGILVGVIIITGWRYWQQRQAKELANASYVYDEMLTQASQNDAKSTLVTAQKLLNNYSHTVYAQMAALMLAKNAVSKNDFKEAEKQLNWVVQHSYVASFRQIARLRLARVLMAEHKPQEVLKLLQTVEDKNFTGLIDEIKGDAYLALNNRTMARQSYQEALRELPKAESVRPLLQMKYEDLIN